MALVASHSGGGKRHSAPEPNGTPIIQIAADHRTEHIKEKKIYKKQLRPPPVPTESSHSLY
jgi:hypothetical protein